MQRAIVSSVAWGIIAALYLPAAAAGQITLHPASAMVRIGGADGESIPPAVAHCALDAVRDEREGIQFAVLSDSAASEDIQINVRASQRAGAPDAHLYHVVAVNHTAPPAEGMFVVPPRRLGWIPDVLVPTDLTATARTLASVADQPPLTFYLEFAVGRQASPGTYRYSVDVTSAGGESGTLAVQLTVHDVALPVRLPFRTATCWNWSLTDYCGRELTTEEKRAFWHFCLDYRLSPCAFFSREPDPTPLEAAELIERGLSLVCLMQVSGRNPRPLSDTLKQRYAPLLQEWRSQLRDCGLQNDAVVLLADEPPESSIDVCRANAAFFKQYFPELKTWIATRPSAAWADFADVFDVVTAHSTELYARHSHDEQAARWWRRTRPFPKGEYWWFHSVEPYAPYTNVRMDNLPIEGRVSGWQSALYAVDGYEYFWITDWKANKPSKDVPWPQRARQWKTGLSGAGTLCYPQEVACSQSEQQCVRPIPSLRLVNLRDGIEDWALLEMLVPRPDTAGRLPYIAPVTTSLQTFTTKPHTLLAARRKVISDLATRRASSTRAGPSRN
ncbi:MAG TPA: glycoside hydrolase domain-containing protein [Phycisphaerae bacterium]|nr:glycoside hydrolase domain-containing protein [Phycisphaerae bacterium]